MSNVNLIESVVNNSFIQFSSDNTLEKHLTHFGIDINEDHFISKVNFLLDFTPIMDTDKCKAKIKLLLSSKSILVPSMKKPSKLKLKPLPESLMS